MNIIRFFQNIKNSNGSKLWPVLYAHINQTLSKLIFFLFDEDQNHFAVLFNLIKFQNTTSVSAFIIFLAGYEQDFSSHLIYIDYSYNHIINIIL